jgi:cell division protein FtsL
VVVAQHPQVRLAQQVKVMLALLTCIVVTTVLVAVAVVLAKKVMGHQMVMLKVAMV